LPLPSRPRADFVIRDLAPTSFALLHPPRWLLDLALVHGLKLLIDIPGQEPLLLDSRK
jgi:hypothetical protein